MQGEKGDMGKAGSKGPKGAKGIPGDEGMRGKPGPRGEMGLEGKCDEQVCGILHTYLIKLERGLLDLSHVTENLKGTSLHVKHK